MAMSSEELAQMLMDHAPVPDEGEISVAAFHTDGSDPDADVIVVLRGPAAGIEVFMRAGVRFVGGVQ